MGMPRLQFFSCISQFNAICLSKVKFPGLWSLRKRQWSTSKAISRIQCTSFSILQWERTLFRMSSGNTRVKVSWEAIPLGSSRKIINYFSLLLPNSSTSSQVSALVITAQKAITKISSSLYSFVRSTRGSSKSPKYCPMLCETFFVHVLSSYQDQPDDKSTAMLCPAI